MSTIQPRLYPNIYVKTINDRNVVVVEIQNNTDKPYQLKGVFYKRVGTSNAYLTQSEVKRMLLENQGNSHRFENVPVTKYHGSLDVKTVQWFIKKAIEERDLPISSKDTPDIILDELELKTDGIISFAGLMGFGENIQRYYPNALLKCAVFDGINKVGAIKAEKVIESNIFEQIAGAQQFFLNNTKETSYIDEESAQRKWKYTWPLLALREAISNAVAHRDYTIASHIDVALFDDRLEISSPGLLPSGITLKELERPHKSKLRNPLIAKLLYLTGYIERWGSGTEKMIQMMKDEGLPIPEYSEQTDSFTVTFYKKDTVQVVGEGGQIGGQINLTDRQLEIIEIIKNNAKVSRKEISEKVGINESAIQKHIDILKEKGALVRIGKTRGHWEITKT